MDVYSKLLHLYSDTTATSYCDWILKQTFTPTCGTTIEQPVIENDNLTYFNNIYYFYKLCNRIENNVIYINWLLQLFYPIIYFIIVLVLLPLCVLLIFFLMACCLTCKKYWFQLRVFPF